MLTLITGSPGSGKSLHGVWELLRPMQTATVEVKGEPVKRVLYTNIKELLLDHELIGGDNLNNWHEWAKPGAIIAFDEVQEVWRPRAMGAKVPDCIAKLETHRHMAVDFVLITQHPNLLDQNIRRLVGRHLHVRRIGNLPLAIVYEWDHCSNPSMVRSAMSSKPWRYPGKKGYALYKSAEAHTKQPRKLPAVAFVLMAAIAAGAYFMPAAYSSIMNRSLPGAEVAKAGKPASVATSAPRQPASAPQRPAPIGPAPAPVLAASAPAPVVFAGCARMGSRCSCYDTAGKREDRPPEVCADESLANAPAKVAEAPQSLDRFQAPTRWQPAADQTALIAWAESQADMRRAGR